MLIDCENCAVRDIACGGCVVSALLADVGLVPPLLHIAPAGPDESAAPAITTKGNLRVS